MSGNNGTNGQKRFLVVDDDSGISSLVRDILQLKGHYVDVAYNGRDGLEKVKQVSPPGYDGVITDYRMPVMDGVEFLKELHQLTGYETTPVVFMSGDDPADLPWVELDAVGVRRDKNYIAKPFNNIADFSGIVDRVMKPIDDDSRIFRKYDKPLPIK